jgi:AcrR family transcriptional regulator
MSRASNKQRSEPNRRTYESPLRQEQAEATRARILDAAVACLAEGGRELTIPEVARGAGVAVRTVYVHFPTKDALLEGVYDALDQRIGQGPPLTLDTVRERVRAFYPGLEANDRLVRAYVAIGGDVRDRASRRRRERIEALVRELAPSLSDQDVVRAGALCHALFSSRTWTVYHDIWDLDGDEAGRAATWALRLVLDALEHDPESFAREP